MQVLRVRTWIPVKVRGALFDVKAKQLKTLGNKINAVISVIVCVCVRFQFMIPVIVCVCASSS